MEVIVLKDEKRKLCFSTSHARPRRVGVGTSGRGIEYRSWGGG